MTLFRRQAIEAQSAQWLGGVHLRSTPSMAVVAAIAALLASLLIGFACWGQVARKTRLVGMLVPTTGTLGIQARDAGIVLERRIEEGQSVKAGDVLLVMDAGRLAIEADGVREMGLQIERAIAARIAGLQSQRTLRQQQHAQRERALADRLKVLEAQYEQGLEEQRLFGQRVQLARANVERHNALAQSGFVSAAQLQAKQEELLDIEGRLQAVRRNLLSIANDRSALVSEKETSSSQLTSDIVDIERSIEAARQEAAENAGRRRTAIAAPIDGLVSAIHLLPGQSVQPGQTLLTLIARSAGTEHDSSGKLVAHLYAPSRSIGFLRKGQRVHLRYDAFPYQKFGMAAGVVAAVSRTPFAPSELPQNVAQQLVARLGAQEALFRAVVELDSQAVHARGVDWPLKPGLMLDADVKQEERAVWEWLLEPLLAWRRVM